jgi:hypothetical protein
MNIGLYRAASFEVAGRTEQSTETKNQSSQRTP